MVFQMAKTLVIAEKPSVGRDLAGALDGPFQRRKLEDIKPKRGKKKSEEETNEEVVEKATSKPKSRTTREDTYFLESDDYVITWAVGHLVQLAEPEEYDEKWKKWRMADLPIVPPDGFKLVPRDARAKKQLKLIETLLKREDVDRIINACDAGREGELIFAYVYESVFGASATNENPPKPVERLWISSMTKQAIREGFAKLRPGPQMQSLELAARSLRGRLARRDERDARRDDPWPRVGRRRGLARPRADADAGDDRQARARDPGVRSRALPPDPRNLPAAVSGTLVRRRRDAHLRGSRTRRSHRREGLGPGRHGREGRAQRTVR